MKNSKELLIFDLDGVLVDQTTSMHHDALLESILKYNPNFFVDGAEEIMNTSLTSIEKISRMNSMGLGIEHVEEVLKNKKIITDFQIDNLPFNGILADTLDNITQAYTVAVASNSHTQTVERVLDSVGILDCVDYFVGNDMVKNNKPHPEVFWKCMSELGFLPKDTSIFEDSADGISAALASGAGTVITVRDNYDLLYILENYVQ